MTTIQNEIKPKDMLFHIKQGILSQIGGGLHNMGMALVVCVYRANAQIDQVQSVADMAVSLTRSGPWLWTFTERQWD